MQVPSEFAVLLLVSFVVSFANEISHGRYLGPALVCLTAALATLAWRFLSRTRGQVVATGGRHPLYLSLMWCALASMPVTALLDPKILAHPHMSLAVLRGLEVASFVLLFTYLPFLGGERESQFVRHARFAAFGAVTLFAGVAIIHISPAPGIDVWDVQMQGAKTLLRGENPYSAVSVPATTPDHAFASVPYVYAPGALYAGVIGLLVGGDVRYAMLIAVLIAGVSLRIVARKSAGGARSVAASLIEDAPALFVWLMPPLAFVIELSWTDPVQLMLICTAVAAVVGGRRLAGAILFGLALSSKQSMFWLLPLAGFAFGFRLREWVAMTATFLLIVAPFAINDFYALKRSTIDFMFAVPARADALCVAVWYKSTFGATFPTVVSPLSAAAVVGATIVRACSARLSNALCRFGWGGVGEERPRSPPPDGAALEKSELSGAALFGRAVALTYFTFFFFAKWAFANYYFLVSGLTALAAATCLTPRRETHDPLGAPASPTVSLSV